MTKAMIEATQTASARWQASFNRADAAGCAACYEEDAVMVAKPFGTYRGRKAIQAFWQDLFDKGFAEVAYVEPKLTAQEDGTVLLASKWTMNKAHGVITRELWAPQSDGSMRLREDHFEALG